MPDERNMGLKLRLLLAERKISQVMFAYLVSPQLALTKDPPQEKYSIVSKQWVGEILQSKNWHARNVDAISKAMGVSPVYWFEPITTPAKVQAKPPAQKKLVHK